MTISRHADAYLDTLPAERRSLAREYARMDSGEFQARVGPSVDELIATTRRIEEKLNAAPAWRRPWAGLAALGAFVGGILYAVIEALPTSSGKP